MDKINQKLNKYRLKLINANSTEKMDFYNLKMQQYLIMQKKLLKSGGSTSDIFALAEDTKSHISSRNDVYSVEEVEKNLSEIKNKLSEVSENYNNNNTEMTKKLIDIRREAMKAMNSRNFSDSPTFNSINDAINAFKSIENVLINYYIDEIKSLNESDNEKIDYIISELALFENNTVKVISDTLCSMNIPEKIKNYLCAKAEEAKVEGAVSQPVVETNVGQTSQEIVATNVDIEPTKIPSDGISNTTAQPNSNTTAQPNNVEVIDESVQPVNEVNVQVANETDTSNKKLKMDGGNRVKYIYKKYF
jgi:hypothetical protein